MTASAARPQPILAPLTSAALFLVLTVREGGEQTVREVLPDVAGLRRSVGFRLPDGGLTCVTGIGSRLWDRLFDGPRPAGLHPFKELRGARHTAPATPGDLLFHLRAHRMDLCFELAGQLMNRLRHAVEVADEVHGFQYFEERDLLGFVDGTENPDGPVAAAAALVAEEDLGFAGGSYVVVQKYLHDMTAWDALPVEAQEHVVGRTKLSDIELPDSVKPADSHVALTSLEQADGADGAERQILRRNMPFGSQGPGGMGTYFIGYSRTPAVTEEMLENMFLGRAGGSHDRLLDFSTAATGSLFFAPAEDFLDAPPSAPEEVAEVVAEEVAVPDGSLAIGSLKRQTDSLKRSTTR